MQADQFLFVGPDNGLFTFVIQRAHESQKPIKAHLLENPQYRFEPVSPVFHGRDLFAPAAAYLAAGAKIEDFGEEVVRPVVLKFPNPEMTENGWKGEVWVVDHFGSLETNISAGLLLGNDLSRITIQIAGQEINGIVNTFSEGKPGDLIALLDSAGRLSISVVNGNAALVLKAGISTPVEIEINE
jgi:S-adenosylmethionine hydrolase